MGWDVENPYGKCRGAARKYLKILAFSRFLRALETWLGGRDSNPDNLLQRQVSYR
jgi:hypothetical protein